MNHSLLVIFISFVFISCSPTTNPPQQHTGSIPTVTTIFANSITQTTANSGGTIVSDGGDSITARGICWSISSNPTVANRTTNEGKGSGTFFSSLTGLTSNTMYFIRAYATNKNGTAYGNQVNFTTVNKTGLTVAGSSNGVSGSTASLLIFPAGVVVDSLGNIYIYLIKIITVYKNGLLELLVELPLLVGMVQVPTQIKYQHLRVFL